MVARMDGARRRLEAEQDGRAWLAWHVAALSRQNTLPELSSLMGRIERPKLQTQEQQISAADQLFLAFGGDPAELARVRAKRDQD
jgi:hypothetical protein